MLLDVKRGALTRFELLKLEPGAENGDEAAGEVILDEEDGEEPNGEEPNEDE